MAKFLAAGYAVRAPRSDEAEAVHAIIVASDIAEFGASHGYTLDALRAEWRELGLDGDAWVVTGRDGSLVGYASIQDRGPVQLDVEVYVHPEHFAQGIGTCLVHRTETRARAHIPLAPPDAQITIHNYINALNPEACHLLAREGYAPVRYFWRMERAFGEAPAALAPPPGVTIRHCRPGEDDRILHAVVEEAMTDHWGHVPLPFDEWERRRHERGFEPDLSFVAFAGEEPVGAAVCRYADGIGWIDFFAVRKPWRNRGLGRALLFQVFGAFFRRGTPRVGLAVDAASLTGATRLYEGAGMTVTQQYATYGKVLRPGAGSDNTTENA